MNLQCRLRLVRALRRTGAMAMVLATVPALASNGLNVVGFGPESLGLGGADIPVSRDGNSMNINPAGMTQIKGRRYDGSLVPFWAFNYKHADEVNDDVKMDSPFGILANQSYVAQALHPDLRFGLGMFVSGGTGVGYEDLNTIFGTRDEYSAVLGVTKLVSAVAWQANDQLSVGLGVNLTYSSTRQKLFPDTSFDAPAGQADFFGLRIDGADGLSWNGRVGVLYKQTPNLTLGVSYSTETDLKLRNGTATINYEAIGLGRVKYRDVRIDGFALAQEFGAGFAWQFNPKWMVAAELNWLDWSHALRDVTVTATRGESADAPTEVFFAQSLNHKDQYVLALGLAHNWSDKTILRAGVNISGNAVPNETLTPTLNLTADFEVAFGFSHQFGEGWEFGSSLQIQGPKSETYRNPEQPYGRPGTERSKEEYGLTALTLQISKSW